ncbi:rhomboid family intramembrane serine protease [Pseudomonas gingeri]|uniref:Rhomboid family intramembrane serine protease n=1 Tax=Pseudomonas gingeri TaxID=117681 RepID=A0A7Y8BIP1_9PSED|nr:rhomboid family intramembrane serine protease [Pseudomonas gingeri]NWB45179.1 rhomboid family intramembrane serine protease [Pseudomonas gingeri]
MERIEPTMLTFTLPPEFPETPGGKLIGTSRARFAVRPQRGQRGTVLRSMLRKGELYVTDEEVVLIKSSRKLFQRATETKLVIPRSQIFDAKTIRKYVYFDIHGPAGIQHVFLIASSRKAAQEILEQLPRQATPAHEAEQAALSSYSERILTLAPITWITHGLIVINVLVYLAMCAGGVGVMAQNLPLTVKWGTNFGPETLTGGWWRLVTSVFVHFGLIHLMLNMFTLYQIGRLAERLYGSGRFLMLYLFAGVTGSIASLLWHPMINSAGASGAIFGVFGGLLVFVLKYRHELPKSIAVQQRVSILVLIGYNLLYGFTHPGIDNGAHLGGLLGGVLLGLTLARPLDPTVRTKVALESTLFSCALVLAVLIASVYPLARSSEVVREELQFKTLVLSLGPIEQQAMKEMAALLHQPADTPSKRAIIANTILQEVIPQWDKLYNAANGAHLPANSLQITLRSTMIRYFDDKRKMCRLIAIMVQHGPPPNTALQAQLKTLESDSTEQIAVLQRMATAVKQHGLH